MDGFKINNKYIAADYLNHCLEKNKLSWPGKCPVDLRSRQPGECETALRRLGDECEERNKQEFEDMWNKLHLSPGNSKAKLGLIADEMFSDGVNWGRVTVFICFAGCVVVRCCQIPELSDLVNDVYDLTVSYLDTKLSSWILENGGWEGFVEFSKCKQENESSWPSFKTICAVGALGVLTLGAFLGQKS